MHCKTALARLPVDDNLIIARSSWREQQYIKALGQKVQAVMKRSTLPCPVPLQVADHGLVSQI